MAFLSNDNPYFLPAEWQPQDGVLLIFPDEETDWKCYLDDITSVYVQLISAIAEHERVVLAARDAARTKSFLVGALESSVLDNVLLCQCEYNDTWARDSGFITLMPARPTPLTDVPRLLDFRFNGWGQKFRSDKDNRINRSLYVTGIFKGTRIDLDGFVLEGGSIESDGLGTVFTTSHCLLAPNRNQPLGRDDIERRLKLYLAASRVVWLDYGRLQGDDTDGHIDTVVRVAPDDTLLYICCDDADDPQYGDFKALERQLQGLRTTGGKPYRLLPLPMPSAVYDDGERLPATYANFLVINAAVILPVYGQSDNDRKAELAVSQAFPNRQIKTIDARAVIRQHGSLHCLTMQFPKGTLNL